MFRAELRKWDDSEEFALISVVTSTTGDEDALQKYITVHPEAAVLSYFALDRGGTFGKHWAINRLRREHRGRKPLGTAALVNRAFEA